VLIGAAEIAAHRVPEPPGVLDRDGIVESQCLLHLLGHPGVDVGVVQEGGPAGGGVDDGEHDGAHDEQHRGPLTQPAKEIAAHGGPDCLSPRTRRGETVRSCRWHPSNRPPADRRVTCAGAG
jgi:hypothetical protein